MNLSNILVVGTFFTVLMCASAFAQPADRSGDGESSARLRAVRQQLPVAGEVLIETSDLDDLAVTGADARSSVVDVEGRDFAKAHRVEVLRRGENAWGVQLQTGRTIAPIKKGDVLFFVLDARAIEAKQESGEGIINGYLQRAAPPWDGVASFQMAVGRDWRTIYESAVAERDWDAGEVSLTMHLAQIPQTLEIGGLIVLNLGPDVDQSKMPFTTLTYDGREPDAPWRKAAAERIEKHRKGDLTVRVIGADDRPVAGADVSVEMTRHAYGFGSFIEGPVIDDSPDGERYREYFLQSFNKATTPVYWADWGWASATSRERYHKMAKWLHEQNVPTRGHVLIWPSWRNMPKDVRPLADDPTTLRRVLREHVREVVEAMKPYDLVEYDVMNEPRAENDLMDLLGRDVIVDWYEEARATDPRQILYINEYSIVTAGGKTEREQEIYEQTIQYLLDQKAPLGGIGIQGHMGSDLTPPGRVVEILDRFAKFNLPIQITEFTVDIRDEQTQADYERDFMMAVFAHPASVGIVRWGFWEGAIWIGSTAQVRKDWTLKPNGQAYRDLVLGEWWTRDRGRTDENGRYTTRGFLGDYRIAVTVGGVTKTVDATLDKGGSEVSVTLGR